ncbi:MAG: hypothetical protein HON70_34230, partial [Lentisphaerae bacterium]|nr:hypothetical protein [Lentisphaerota bacterium]
MKTAAMIGVLGVVLGVGVFGVREAWSYVQGTAVQVRKEVKANIPIGVELSRVEKMLDNLSAVIARQRDQVVR